MWALQCADISRLAHLCDEAVVLAGQRADEAGQFWSHLSRALLCTRHKPRQSIRDDVDCARALRHHAHGPRAFRLLAIAEATALSCQGLQEEALQRFQDMPLDAAGSPDEADNYFVLRGIVQAASRLQRLECLFDALYGNLVLTERTGPPVRHAVALAELASALVDIGRYADALDVLGAKVHASVSQFSNPVLSGNLRILAAIAKYGLGRAIEAHNDLQCLVGDGTADLSRGLAYLIHANLMGVCIHRGLHEEAHRSASQAQDCASGMRRRAPMGVCLQGAGAIAHAQGDTDRAVELLERALQCYEDDLPLIAPMHSHVDAGAMLSDCHAARSRLKLAYTTHRSFFDIHRRRVEFAARGQLAALKAQQNVAAGIRLSEREVQCLSWSAAGKTAWETGKILELSEWTVVYHIEKAKRKFGLTRKQEVIAHAISLGLIKPYDDVD